MLPLIAAAFTLLALALLAAGLAPRAARSADARVRALASPYDGGTSSRPPSFGRWIVAPSIGAIGHGLAAVLPAAFLRRTEKQLALAGQPLSATAFYAIMLATGVLFAGGCVALAVVLSDGMPSVLALLLAVLLTALGLYLPLFWLGALAKARQSTMLRGLPDTLDLLTLCVEAGLGLEGALYRVVEKQTGPLAEEIRQMLREVGLGKSRRDGLIDLAERMQLDDIRSLATALIQAEQLGTSAAKVLRAQAQRLRLRRRQHAEQDARRASVRMVFPLVFCLMPSLFIFILGPVIVSVYGFLSKS